MHEFLRNLLASEQPGQDKFNVVDPTAVGDDVRSITLAITPATEESPTSVVSIFWTESANKVFEKQFEDAAEAQQFYETLRTDLQEVAELTKGMKAEEAGELTQALLERYSVHTDNIVDGKDTPVSMTNASQNKDNTKEAGKVVMQNIFFSDPQDLVTYQEKIKGKGGTPFPMDKAKKPGEGLDEEKLPGKDEEAKEPKGEDDIGPASVSYDEFAEKKEKSDKSMDKRIQREIRDQVESALQEKTSTMFTPEDESLVTAMRNVGCTWGQIKEYMIKQLKYDEEGVGFLLAEMQQREGGNKGIKPPEDRPAEPKTDAPAPAKAEHPEIPKPPADLVTPETHDALVKEVEDASAMPLASHRNWVMQIVADNPLETRPNSPSSDSGSSNAEDFPKTDFPEGVEVDHMKDPAEAPHDNVVDFPAQEPLKPGDSVHVIGDYGTGSEGFSGKFISQYKSEGEEYAIIEDERGEAKDPVVMSRVKKASLDAEVMAELRSIQAALEEITADLNDNCIACPHASHGPVCHAMDCECDGTSMEMAASKKTAFKDDTEMKTLWEQLRDIPVTEDGVYIDADFLNWPKGTELDSIWHWFDENYSKGVAALMGLTEDARKHEASKKTAAEPEAPAPTLPAAQPTETEKDVPTNFKPYKISPPGTKDKEVTLGDEEMVALSKEFETTLHNIDTIEATVKTMKAEFEKGLKQYKTDAKYDDLLTQRQNMVEKIAALVAKTKTAVVAVGDKLYSYFNNTEKVPVKVGDKELLEKAKKLYPQLEKQLQDFVNGMQSQQTQRTIKELIMSPFKRSHQLPLSPRVEKVAEGDILESIYNSLLAVYETVTEILSPDAPVTASKE